jgi:hypothetical protein
MLKRAGWAHTDSIYHAWRSKDYILDGDTLTFTKEDGSAESIKLPLLVHGCKDGSLHTFAATPAVPVVPPAPIAVSAPSTQPAKPPVPVPEPSKPAPVVKQSTIPEPIAEAIRSRFILGPVTEEEEAGWPCTKAEFEAFLKENKKKAKRGATGSTRLRVVVDHFGFKNMDVGRRAIGHWGYEAPKPSTYLRKAKK